MGFLFKKNKKTNHTSKFISGKSNTDFNWISDSSHHTPSKTSYTAKSPWAAHTVEQEPISTPVSSFPTTSHTNTKSIRSAWTKFLICLFFGYFGVHKFMEKKIGMGILYFFTVGLFGFGWFYDVIRCFVDAIKLTIADTKQCAHPNQNFVSTGKEFTPVETPSKPFFSIKKILLWILTVFLVLFTFAFLPHISGFIALAAAIIVVPIEKWQNILTRFVKGKVKTAIVTVMTIIAFFSVPTSEPQETPPAEPVTSVLSTTEATEHVVADLSESDTEASSVPPTLPPAEIERISFIEEAYTVGVGRTMDIPFILYPENANIATLEASIDNTENAILSFEKKDRCIVQVTGLTPGNATITLSAGDAIIATSIVTIEEVMPEEIRISANPQSPEIGSSGVFTVTFVPSDVTTQDIEWQSDNPNIIKVNDDGSFDAISIGEATITATHKCGITGTLLINVLPIEADSVSLTSSWEESKPFYKNDSMALIAVVYPENTTDKTITWMSSDETVATVSDKGVVKAVSAGSATITATASNGVQATYAITVTPSPQKFRVITSITMKSNDHVGYSWSSGFEFNDAPLSYGSIVSITVGDTFTVCGWAMENDSKPDYDCYLENLTLTNEMCKSGFVVEGEFWVTENGGRYSGSHATWYVKVTFTPIN